MEALPDKELRDWAVARYGITQAGEAHGEVAGSNVLYRALDTAALADTFPGGTRRRSAAALHR